MMGSRNIVIAHDLGMVVVTWCMALFARFNFEVPPLPFLASGFNALAHASELAVPLTVAPVSPAAPRARPCSRNSPA